MSKSSMQERNKAIRKAWEREKEFVSQGKGTRDWTEEQQRDILDPNKGKTYDENGRAFEGQHMKSVAEYPEYQGDPNNIQFLTREEHLAAHKGSWKNPTNWYYNPETKEFMNFGENELIPCEAIFLSNPVMRPIIEAQEGNNEPQESHKMDEASTKRSQPSEQKEVPHQQKSSPCKNAESKSSPKTDGTLGNKIIQTVDAIKEIGKNLSMKHPTITKFVKLGGIAVFFTGIAVAANSASGGGKSSGGGDSDSSSSPDLFNGFDIPSDISYHGDENLDAVENSENEAVNNCDDSTSSMNCPEKCPYTPNDVPEGEQHYHYKDGVRLGKRAAYHREGKHDDDK